MQNAFIAISFPISSHKSPAAAEQGEDITLCRQGPGNDGTSSGKVVVVVSLKWHLNWISVIGASEWNIVCITCQTCAGCHFGCGLRPALHHTRPTKPCSCILKALVTRLTWVDIRTFKEEREAVPRVYCTQTRPPIQCVLTETRPISAQSPKQPITDYDQRPGSVRLSSFILKNELKSLQNMCETEVARQPCDQLP